MTIYTGESGMEKRIRNRITSDILSETATRYGMEPTEGEGRILRHGGCFPAAAFRRARGRYAWETGLE